MKTAKKIKKEGKNSYVQHSIPKIKEQTKSKKRHNSGPYLPEYFL
jgi:hypothetical protein